MTPTVTPTVTPTNALVAPAISRALAIARADGHEITGLLDMDPSPLATGLCMRCGGQLSVSFHPDHFGVPRTQGTVVTGRCTPAAAWPVQADAQQSLHLLAVAAEKDPRFLAHPLAVSARQRRLDPPALARRLDMFPSALDRLALYGVPQEGKAGEEALQHLKRETGANPERLGVLLAAAPALIAKDAQERQQWAAEARSTQAFAALGTTGHAGRHSREVLATLTPQDFADPVLLRFPIVDQQDLDDLGAMEGSIWLTPGLRANVLAIRTRKHLDPPLAWLPKKAVGVAAGQQTKLLDATPLGRQVLRDAARKDG